MDNVTGHDLSASERGVSARFETRLICDGLLPRNDRLNTTRE